VFAFALRYPSLFEPRWYGDEGIFAAIASNVRHGAMLYSGAWDNKPPLIYYTYAAAQSLFGTGVMPLHATAMAFVLLTQAAVVGIALLLFDGWRAAISAVIFAFLLGTPLIEGDLAMTETFMILPVTLAVLLFAWSEHGPARAPALFVAIGFLLGIGTAYKQVAVFDGAAIAVMLWLLHARRERAYVLRSIAAIAAGFAIPQAALALLFVATGAFGAYWYAVVGSLGLYAQMGPQVSFFARLAAYIPALIVITVLVYREQHGERLDMRSFPALWLSFALIGVTSSAFGFPHYLQQGVAPLALTVVSLPFAVPRDVTYRAALGAAGVLVFAVIFGQFGNTYQHRQQLHPVRYYQTFVSHEWGAMSSLDYKYRFDGSAVTIDDVSSVLQRDSAGNTLFTWSEQLPWVYAETGMRNPTPYYTSFLGDRIPGARDEIMRDLEAHPPVYIVVSQHAYAPFDELQPFLASRYGLLHSQGDWRIYRLASVRGNLPLQEPPAVLQAR
jgi:MFS family permease